MPNTCRNPLAIGYYALIYCVLKRCTVEQAFDYLETGRKIPSEKETEEMMKMRAEKMTYREIGEMYGISMDAAYKRIKRLKEKRA